MESGSNLSRFKCIRDINKMVYTINEYVIALKVKHKMYNNVKIKTIIEYCYINKYCVLDVYDIALMCHGMALFYCLFYSSIFNSSTTCTC